MFSLTGNGAGLICIFEGIFLLDEEGKTWARGWNTKAASAFRTVVALCE